MGGTLTCDISSDYPAIFTAVDDNSVGEEIGNGHPEGNYYANPAIWLTSHYSTTSYSVSKVRVKYAELAFLAGDNCNLTLSDSEVNQGQVMAVLGMNDGYTSPMTLTCNNCLFNGVSYCSGIFAVDYGSSQGDYYHLNNCTIDNAYYLIAGPYCYYDSGIAVNSIFGDGVSASGNWQGSSYNGFYNCSTFGTHSFTASSNPFQAGADGNYYLAANLPFRNVGTTAIDQALLTDIESKTTYTPQGGGWPDGDRPDLGYHYYTTTSLNQNSDQDGLPDWWEMSWFGSLDHAGTDLDGGGANTLLYYYQHGLDPNLIQFSINVANNYVTTGTPTLQLNIANGFPSYYAVLVDNNNFGSANWVAYTGPSLSVNLGSTQGSHNVWIGLRGLSADAEQNWQETTLVLDSTSPTISIASPADNSTFGTVRVNVAGTFSENYLKQITVNGVPAYVNGNLFEVMNVPLAVGANTLTATLQNLAGNIATASISATGGANPVDPVQLQATPIAGFAPLNVTFQVSANVPGTIQQVLYDFNGDGISDQTATGLTPISHTFSSAGQYFPVVTVVTDAGRFSSTGGWNSTDPSRLRINVQSPPTQQNVINITDPVDLKCDAAGNVYVLSRTTATITEYNSSGVSIRSLSGIGSAPRGLDVDSAGRVYVADTGDNQVLKFNPTASSFQLDATFGSAGVIGKSDKTSGTGNGEFNAPFDVAVSPDGATIAVSDSGNHRIQRFALDGSFVEAFGQFGSATGQFNTPEGLAYDGQGYLFIVDSGNSRIVLAYTSLLFPGSGTSIVGTSGTSGAGLGQFQGVVNLGIGQRGIYTAETGNNRVQSFEPALDDPEAGIGLTPFNLRGVLSTESELNQPNAVAPVADFLQEKLYVADTGNNRVILVSVQTASPVDVWNAMQQKLLTGDVSGALPYFSSLSADKYRTAFLSIGATGLNQIMGQVGTISPVVIYNDTAECRFDQQVDGVTITFPIEFILENGTWKIEEF